MAFARSSWFLMTGFWSTGRAIGRLMATVPPFYATSTAVLVALLITWLVAEARGLREDLIVKPEAAYIRRIPKKWIIPIALGLAAGVVVALRVQFRIHADTW